MLTVKHDESLGDNSWKLWRVADGSLQVVTRCTNGHIGQLVHEISVDGVVSPSVVCQREGCSFHEFIVLDGWAEVVKMAEREGLSGRPPFAAHRNGD